MNKIDKILEIFALMHRIQLQHQKYFHDFHDFIHC